VSRTWYQINETCWDCGSPIGDPHAGGCDVARCELTGMQRISCSSVERVNHSCGDALHDGFWPGDLAAASLGFWTYWDGAEWQTCAPTHPRAMPDLNRLSRDARWHPVYQVWVNK